MNRADRRLKKKDRRYTKKGITRVIFVDDEFTPHTIFTAVGSKMHRKAKRNAKDWRKQQRDI